LLGRYDDFPATIQRFARFTYESPTPTLQTVIVKTLHQLNKQTVDMKTFTPASPPNCFVNFEFGVADTDTFNFLDEEELQKIENTLNQQALPILDIFCATRYHIRDQTEKRKTLKADYNMLRFTFYQKNMELFIHNERGTQRIPLKDLILFLKSQIDQELAERRLETLTLKRIL